MPTNNTVCRKEVPVIVKTDSRELYNIVKTNYYSKIEYKGHTKYYCSISISFSTNYQISYNYYCNKTWCRYSK